MRTVVGGRGGRRFQVLAIALTYLAVAFAYAPIAVKGALKDRAESHASASAEDAAAAAKPAKSAASLVTALAVLVGLILALPVLVIVGSMPSGLISAAIIFFGMKQAWNMTSVPALQITGPHRIAAPPAPSA